MRDFEVSRRLVDGFLLALLALSLAPGRLSAQVVKGSISGTVVDASGASIPDAEVSAREKNTGETHVTHTGTAGAFKLSLLSVGTYDLTISKQGFQKTAVGDVVVSVAVDYGIGTVTLKVGAVTTTVEVTAAPPLVTSTESQTTATFSRPQITTFPGGVMSNQGLDFLALQVPGVVNNRDLGFSNTNGPGFATNGIRGRNNDQELDGMFNNDSSIGGPDFFLSNTDFVQEYQVITNNFAPEWGRNSGSVVNIITPSGSNSWHGDVFGTESNSRLNSLSNNQKVFQKLKKPPRFNDEFAGGSAGGPIKKDDIFVFGGFDQEDVSSSGVFSTGSQTPTPIGVGQLSACFPNSGSVGFLRNFGPFALGGNPTVNGTPKVVTLTDPNGNPCPVEVGGVKRTLPNGSKEYDSLFRVDVSHPRDHISFRWLFQRSSFFDADFGSAAAGYPVSVIPFSQLFGVSWVHSFSPTFVNEVRFSYSRLSVLFGGNTLGSVPPATSIDQAISRVTISAPFLSFGPMANIPQGRINNVYQTQDNWTYIRGRHQMKGGINWTFQREPDFFLPNVNGNFRFPNLQRFAADTPSSITVAAGQSVNDIRENDIFAYFGDDIKLRPNFTLNVGVTYSFFTLPQHILNTITTKRESNSATAFFNPSLPLSVRTFPALPNQNNNWGPSVGFAYSPKWGGWLSGNGKLVLRGGYRLAYDPVFYNIWLNEFTAAPEVLLQTLTGAKARANPLLANSTGPVARQELASSLVFGVADPRSFNQTQTSPNFGRDLVQSWSFGVQRQLTTHSALEVRYVANHGSNLFQTVNTNPFVADLAAAFPSFLPAGVTPCSAADAVVKSAIGRVNCNEGVVRARTNSGVSDYQSLQTQYRATDLAHQLTVVASYTFSHTTDNASEIFSTFGAGGTIFASQNPLDFVKGEHGNSGLDIPNNFTINFTERLPFFREQKGVLAQALGGWSFSGTYIASSGQPYTPVQFALNTFSGGVGNDFGFDTAFIGTFETSRPFLSNPSAPVSQVGIFAADACGLFGAGCSAAPNTLLNFNTINNGSDTTGTAIAASAVRFIVNGGEAQTVFGKPFGTVGRNTLRDYHTSTGNFAIFKDFRLNDHIQLRQWTDFTNVFNHPNFGSVDPFIDDAGLAQEATGFGVPQLTDGGHRTIRFGLRILF